MIFPSLPHSLRPSKAQMHLLRTCVATDAAAAEKSLSEWERLVDLNRLECTSFNLLPLLYRRVKAFGLVARDSGRLTGIYRHAWMKREVLKRAVKPVLQGLHDAGIPVLLFKGAVLGERFYPDPVTRTMSDVDILVREDRARAAVGVLESYGWHALQIRWEQTFRWLHALGFAKAKTDPGIDLHWHALRTIQDPALTARIWNDVSPYSWLDIPMQTLRDEHHFLHACDHGARFNFYQSLRWFVDCSLIIQKAGSDFDWEFLVEEAKSARAALAVCKALEFLRGSLCPDIPSAPANALRHSPVKWVDRISFRFDCLRTPARPKVRHVIIQELFRYVRNYGLPLTRLQRMHCHEFLQALFISPRPFFQIVAVPIYRIKTSYWAMRRTFGLLLRGGAKSFNWRPASISRWSEKSLRGFYELEYFEEAGHRLLRWAGPKASIYIPHAERDLDVEMELLPYRPARTTHARFFINDIEIPEKYLRKRVDSYRIQLRRPWRPERGGCWLDWTVTPWDKSINDSRDLGLPVLSIRVSPLHKSKRRKSHGIPQK